MSLSNRSPAGGQRAATPAASPNRLPGGRERRPALAALAVILILLGAAGSALIAVRSGEREGYLAVTKDLPPGHKIDRKDLARGDLAGDTGPLVPVARLDEFVGQYTTSWLYENQYVTQDDFTRTPVPEGGALVGVSLESGRAPSDPIREGDIVRVIRVPAANQDAAVPTVLVSAAVVTGTEGAITDARTNANTTLNVTVLVPAQKATGVAAAAAAKTIVLVKLSSATKPEIDRTEDGN